MTNSPHHPALENVPDRQISLNPFRTEEEQPSLNLMPKETQLMDQYLQILRVQGKKPEQQAAESPQQIYQKSTNSVRESVQFE